LNEDLKQMKIEQPKSKVIKKMESADEYTVVLMQDNTLYVWGKNDRG